MAKKRSLPERSTDALSPEQIKAIRTGLGLTQAEAADRIGVARRTWMYWESPTRGEVPSARAIKLILLLKAGQL